MANRIVLLGLLILCVAINYTESKRSFGRNTGRITSSSLWGKSSQPSASWSTSNNKPSSSYNWGSWPALSFPSSASRLSGLSSSSHRYPPPRSSYSSHGYPSSESALSRLNPSSYGLSRRFSRPTIGYPSSGSGLSGSSSGLGLLGSTSNSHRYFSPGSGLSGSSSVSHKYLTQGSGLSGSGTSTGLFGIPGTHTYPKPLSGVSGSASVPYNYQPVPSYGRSNYKPYDNSYRPIHTYNTMTGARPHYYGTPSPYITSYSTAPQYVYVHEYRNSKSRFSDLLTGLSLYNLGRSHSQYHNHYFYDDYYRRRYHSHGSLYRSASTPSNKAQCLLRVKADGKLEVLKIPCEIVSTFTEESKKVEPTTDTSLNKTVCTTNSTVVNNTLPVNGSSVNFNVTTNVTVVNHTVCTMNSFVLDPLTVKGPAINAKNMECAVEIHTKQGVYRNEINCATLISYAKMPESKENRRILPPREKLKSWVSKPPW